LGKVHSGRRSSAIFTDQVMEERLAEFLENRRYNSKQKDFFDDVADIWDMISFHD